MSGVLEGFGIIAVVILAGYLLGRSRVLGEGAPFVLSRFVFFAASPALLFTVLATADTRVLISPLLAVAALSALTMVVITVLVSRLVWRRTVPQATVAALAAGYVNANNIGLPVAIYVLGSAAYPAPVILLQLLLYAPAGLVVLEHSRGRGSPGRTVLRSLANPMLIASLLGAVLALTHVQVPTPVLEPLRLIGGAAVPLMLMGFGMSLHGQRVLQAGSGRRDVVLATGLKLIGMPLTAWILGAFVFHVDADLLRATVILAGLPTAQNVLVYAMRYERSVILARDTVLLTTLGSLPVLLVVSLLLPSA
ncbi:MAG: malonate transporter [Microbacteriaceae bacterium]|jgi:malonate transporter|nr:malonate transporter [Microbacteriaceae bacterium]